MSQKTVMEYCMSFFESQLKVCSKSNIVDFDDVVSEICENVPSEQVVENIETSNENTSAEILHEYVES